MKSNQFALAGLVLVALLVGVYVGNRGAVRFSGASDHQYYQQYFVGGATFGTDTNTKVSSYQCYTGAYDPGSVSSSTAADTKAFLTPSASAGDVVFATLDSVTSTQLWTVDAKITAGSGTTGATTTLYLTGRTGAAINLTTTTAKVCVLN